MESLIVIYFHYDFENLIGVNFIYYYMFWFLEKHDAEKPDFRYDNIHMLFLSLEDQH